MSTSLTARAPSKTLLDHYLGFLSTHNPLGYREVTESIVLCDQISAFIALVRKDSSVGLTYLRVVVRSLPMTRIKDRLNRREEFARHNLVAQMAGYKDWPVLKSAVYNTVHGKRLTIQPFDYATNAEVDGATLIAVKAKIRQGFRDHNLEIKNRLAEKAANKAAREKPKPPTKGEKRKGSGYLELLNAGKEVEFWLGFTWRVHPVVFSKLIQAQRDGSIHSRRLKKLSETVANSLECDKTSATLIIARILGHRTIDEFVQAEHRIGPKPIAIPRNVTTQVEPVL